MALKNKVKTGAKKINQKLAKKKAAGNPIKKAVKAIKKVVSKKIK